MTQAQDTNTKQSNETAPSASPWWTEQKATHCCSCGARIPKDRQPGEGLPCGH